MKICKLDMEQLTPEQFEQIVAIEENCGLEPYSREMLLDCIENLDTYACLDGDTVAGFITLMPSPPFVSSIIPPVSAKVHRKSPGAYAPGDGITSGGRCWSGWCRAGSTCRPPSSAPRGSRIR